VVEVAQSSHVTELERVNTELRVEIEQAWIKIAEVEDREGSLHSGYERLEHECGSLCNVAETLQ
jgi:hypothetical protein